jgi:hypothetical protein
MKKVILLALAAFSLQACGSAQSQFSINCNASAVKEGETAADAKTMCACAEKSLTADLSDEQMEMATNMLSEDFDESDIDMTKMADTMKIMESMMKMAETCDIN